jgi:hypothetical protein
VSRRFEQSQRRRAGIDGQYQGFNWQLDGSNRFELEVSDPDGGEPESKTFDTYVQLCEFVEREIAARAKRYTCRLPVVAWASSERYREADHVEQFVLTGINRTSSRVSAKGGELRAEYILPDVPAMHELLAMFEEQDRKLQRILRMLQQFAIERDRRYRVKDDRGNSFGPITLTNYEEAVKLLEKEYAEKRAAAYEFDPGAELRMLEAGHDA